MWLRSPLERRRISFVITAATAIAAIAAAAITGIRIFAAAIGKPVSASLAETLAIQATDK